MRQPPFASTAPYIAWHAHETPCATAIVEDAVQTDYQTLAALLARCVSAPELSGITPGMVVGVEVRSTRMLHLLLLLACEVLGATTVSITEPDLWSDDKLIRDCGLLLLDDANRVVSGPGRQAIPSDWLDRIATRPVGPQDLERLFRDIVPERALGIFRTSGTTGRPKVMAVSHIVQQRNIEAARRDRAPVGSTLCLYSLSVQGMHRRVRGCLQAGATVIFAQDEDAPQLFSAGLVNHVVLTVGDAERIAKKALPPPSEHRVSVALMGASASPDLRRLLRERLNADLSASYSSNEVGLISATDDNNLGTLGSGVQVRIVDESGHDLPPGAHGLIRVRTEAMVDGYLNDPAATAAAFIDGWYHTNDVGYMPAPDKLVVLGRADDMLNIGGVKLPPASFEDAIRSIPGVTDAALLVVESATGIGVLVVAVEVPDGQPPADLADRLHAILSGHTRTYETMSLSQFPRTETAKVQRQQIREAFLRRGDPAQPHTIGKTMPTLTVDGREFEIETLSEAATAQWTNIQFVDAEITRLTSLIAVAQTARNAYLEALRAALPVG